MKITKFLTILILIIAMSYAVTAEINYYTTILDNPAPGYIFTGPLTSQHIGLIDNIGKKVHIDTSEFLANAPTLNLKVQPNGYITFFFSTFKKFYALDENYTVIDSFQCANGYETDYHELLVLPNGNALLFGLDVRKIDMSMIISGGSKEAEVVGYVLQELDSKKNLVFEWKSFDHIKITDATKDVDLLSSSITYLHCNSIDIDWDGNIIISSRFLDEITKINRTTGEIIWRLGGSECKNNQFRFTNDTVDGFFGFSHQHSAMRLSNGNILLFDNGNLNPTGNSRAVEYSIDEVNKTVSKVWEYRHNPDIVSPSQGNVQRLPNGNTLICWGGFRKPSEPAIVEVRQDGSIAFEMVCDLSGFYRAFRYVKKMASVTKPINIADNYDFNDSINRTGIRLNLSSIDANGNVTIEKHEYKPHNIEFEDSIQLFIFPIRWVISHSGIEKIRGTIQFDLDIITNISQPNKVKIYQREHEGTGVFVELPTSYNSSSNEIEASFDGFGEFMICADSILSIESNEVSNIELSVHPNPVKTIANFSIIIPEDSYCTIRIFNQLGMEVISPIFDFMKCGSGTIPIDCNNLNAGVYYYRFSTGKFNKCGRFIIME